MLKRLFLVGDMTEGKPWKSIMIFAIPMLIGNIAQQLYNTSDAIIVGMYMGDNALAAVGATTAIYSMLLALFIGVSSGTGIMVAQYFGAKRREDLSSAVGASMMTMIVSALVLMIFGPLGTRKLLGMLDTPSNIIDMSVTYINILLWGSIGIGSYNILAGILRGMGDSYSPFIYLLTTSVLGVFLNWLFVGVFGWGIAGAAAATILCQILSGLLCLLRLLKMRHVFDLRLRHLWPKKRFVNEVIRLGLPTGISQAVFAAAMLLVQSLINGFGTEYITVNKIVMSVDGYIIMPVFAVGNAIMAFTGQNVGAGKMDRVKQGARQCLFMSLGVTILTTSLVLIFGRSVTGLFTDTPAIQDRSIDMLRLLMVGYLVFSLGNTYWSVQRGAGDTVTPMWASFIVTIVIRVPVAYLLVYLTGQFQSTYYSTVLTWVLSAVLGAVMYYKGRWRTKGIVKSGKAANVYID